MRTPTTEHPQKKTGGRLGYRPELDGFRAVAILAVLVFHSRIWFPRLTFDGGELGVDLFFVLSGFLITSLLLREYATEGSFSRKAFYSRRALRLLPALALALILGAVVTHVLNGNGKGALAYSRAALASLFFAGNWFQYKLGTLAHTWSLGVEEQYYLIWPFALAFALRKRRPTVGLAATLGILAVVIAGARSVIYHTLTSSSPMWKAIHPWSRLDGVLIGSALAVLLASTSAASLRQPLRDRTLAAAALVCALAIVLHSAITNPRTYDTLFLVNICFALLIGHVFVDPSGPVGRVLRLQPLPAIGKISYGLYIFHWPLFFLTRQVVHDPVAAAVTAVAATFAIAIASYFVVERPMLHIKSKHSTPRRAHSERPGRSRATYGAPRLPVELTRRIRERAAAA